MRKKRSKNRVKGIILAIILLVIVGLIIHERQKVMVCIDAGHGGKDAGSVSSNGKRYEKEDNLRIALRVKEKLEAQGISVILTREDDTFVSLGNRCKIANWRGADLFVSLHRNSSEKGNGVEIWVSEESDEISEKLALDILTNLEKVGIQQNRGVKSGTSENNGSDYFVNRNTKMPSCLIELGFISNAKDNELLDENLEEYAEAIAKGILQNLKEKGKKV